MKERARRIPLKTILLCAAMLSLAVVVCAAAPRVIEYWNMVFLKEDSVERLRTVPDGYIGIYDAEDLNAVRDDLAANYILMNDIVITEADYAAGGIFENGFTPIGSDSGPYRGTFNGNGYVIDGLVITQDSASDSRWYTDVGLFGKVQRATEQIVVENDLVSEADMGMDINGDGVISDEAEGNSTVTVPGDGYMRGGIVKNLGLTNMTITVTKAEPYTVRIGAIAGSIDFLVGCYAENVTITVQNDTTSCADSVGGLAGRAEYVDSCYTDAVVRYESTVPYVLPEDATFGVTTYLGGVVGQTYACVTSYFDGALRVYIPEETDAVYMEDGIANLPDGAVPAIVTGALMDKMGELEDEWLKMKFRSFYRLGDYKDLEIAGSQYTTDNDTEEEFYVLDPEAKPREIRELSKIITQAFTDVSFADFCRENNVKYDVYHCYDLRFLTECDFEGFDFDFIWTREGHANPTLRLFEGGSLHIDDHNSAQNRIDLGK